MKPILKERTISRIEFLKYPIKEAKEFAMQLNSTRTENCNWFMEEQGYLKIKRDVEETWELCPKCKTFPDEGVFKNYCPNCGAKIDKEVNSAV